MPMQRIKQILSDDSAAESERHEKIFDAVSEDPSVTECLLFLATESDELAERAVTALNAAAERQSEVLCPYRREILEHISLECRPEVASRWCRLMKHLPLSHQEAKRLYARLESWNREGPEPLAIAAGLAMSALTGQFRDLRPSFETRLSRSAGDLR